MIYTTIPQLQELIARASKCVDKNTPIVISAVANKLKAIADNQVLVAYVGPVNPNHENISQDGSLAAAL